MLRICRRLPEHLQRIARKCEEAPVSGLERIVQQFVTSRDFMTRLFKNNAKFRTEFFLERLLTVARLAEEAEARVCEEREVRSKILNTLGYDPQV